MKKTDMLKVSIEIFKDGFNPKTPWRAKVTLEGLVNGSMLTDGSKTKKSMMRMIEIAFDPKFYEVVVWRNFELDK